MCEVESIPPLPRHSLPSPVPVLGELEIGQHVVPRPAAIAELRPMVVVLGLAAHIDEAVDRARAAQATPARIEDGAAGGAGIGLGAKAPARGRMVQELGEAGRDMDQGVPVAPARLDQQHLGAGVLAQAIGENAAGRAGADDDVIDPHGVPPGPLPGRPGAKPAFLSLFYITTRMPSSPGARERRHPASPRRDQRPGPAGEGSEAALSTARSISSTVMSGVMLTRTKPGVLASNDTASGAIVSG